MKKDLRTGHEALIEEEIERVKAFKDASVGSAGAQSAPKDSHHLKNSDD